MRRHAKAPPPESWSAYPPGSELLPLGLLMVAGYLQFAITVWFILNGIGQSSLPHMHLNAVLTPLVFLVAVGWTALRLVGLVTPETATGFSLAAYGLAARGLAEFRAWIGPPPGHAVFPDGSPTLLMDLVRHLGLIACVTGLAFVVASSARAIGWSSTRRVRVRPGLGAWIAAVLCFAGIGMLVYLCAPAVIRLQAS